MASRRVRGAVWDGRSLAVSSDLELREPGAGEVMVELAASGICHSDLNVIDGTSPMVVPVVLGHEGAGRIAAVGPGVDGWSVGDPVAICSLTPCFACRACAVERFSDCASAFGSDADERTFPYRYRGERTRAYANCSSFASHTTVRADQLVAVDGIPAAQAALLGCAVCTGYGVVRNVARVRDGDRVAVFGVGGIGVNALQTARLQGAAEIVAVDVDERREAIARRFGATAFVRVSRDDDAGALRRHVGSGFDAVIECSGALAAIEAAPVIVGTGGVVALVGIPPKGAKVSYDVNALLRGKRIVGSLGGAVHPVRDFRDIVEHVRAGRLELAAQVTGKWPLDQIGDAITALRAGEVIRAVVLHDGVTTA